MKQLASLGKLCVVLLGVFTTCAQAMTIAVLDEHAAMVNNIHAQKARTLLKEQTKPKQQQLDKLRASIEKLEQKYQKQSKSLTKVQHKHMQEQAEHFLHEYTALAEDIETQIESSQHALHGKLRPALNQVTQEIIEQRGIDIILHKEMVYAVSKDWDLTPEVIKKLNQLQIEE